MADAAMHPRRWSVRHVHARCELCGCECWVMRLEVAEDRDLSSFVCTEHAMPADITHPLSPTVYAKLFGERRRVAA